MAETNAPDVLSAEEIDRLETLEKKATPPGWIRQGMTCHANGRGVIAHIPTASKDGVFDCSANADFIPDLRNAAPALIRAARENAVLRKRITKLEKALTPFAEAFDKADRFNAENDRIPVLASRHLLYINFVEARAALDAGKDGE